jgi:hypothetical protein
LLLPESLLSKLEELDPEELLSKLELLDPELLLPSQLEPLDELESTLLEEPESLE